MEREMVEGFVNGSMNLDFLDYVLNRTLEDKEKYEWSLRRYQTNLFIEGWMLYLLILLYGLLITFGTVGNCLTVIAVVRKAAMRTPRNIWIVNLAVSDTLLCLITMPLTLVQIVTATWPFPPHEFLCKTIFAGLHAVSIFVSTISITAIALDRYHVIVYPTKPSVQRVGVVVAIGGIWSLALAMATPLFVWSILEKVPLPPNFQVSLSMDHVYYCYEKWPVVHGRLYFSIFSIIVQYVLPITVVSVAYCRICKKLRYRMKPGCRPDAAAGQNQEHGNRRTSVRKDRARVRRTNTLLISISVIFGISWMPLNLFNLIADLYNPFEDDQYTERIIFAFCHLLGMSSANTNPLLYGYFNDNFRKEFRDIWGATKDCCTRRSSQAFDRGGRGGRGESRVDNCRETTTVQYRKSTSARPCAADQDQDQVEEGMEQSTLITQVLDRQK